MLPARFTRTFLIIIIALVVLMSLFTFHGPTRAYLDPYSGRVFDSDGVERDIGFDSASHPESVAPLQGVHGGVIMSKLGNETAKQALGRAAWKLMHTMTLRFPEEPTEDERSALDSYFHLQSRLYPCGECATEFQKLLKEFPPQTSSRRAAALWLCHVHNQVNERLEKPIFDCAHLDDTYDCGCGDEPINKQSDGLELERDGLTGAGLIKGGK
ncbi:ERV/ALR sulfhydryl oxidase domain-containing protein [Phellopilus nigrolimitatus]|nr:ERV/ALR sulfhydryl oxidase domain-containing protein [Phellopilus nigrolimitatus]